MTEVRGIASIMMIALLVAGGIFDSSIAASALQGSSSSKFEPYEGRTPRASRRVTRLVWQPVLRSRRAPSGDPNEAHSEHHVDDDEHFGKAADSDDVAESHSRQDCY
jgi:hypothetical protein